MRSNNFRKISGRYSSLVFIAVFSVLCAVSAANAATITVNTIADENGTGADCSLREAIQAANSDAAFGGCTAGAGADVIEFDGGVFGTAQTIALPNGQLSVSTVITINGTGANLLTLQNTLAASASSRVFQITGGGNLSLSGATLTGGNVNGGNGGGGVAVSGVSSSLTLTNVHITGNTADGYGAGINLGTSSTTVNLTNCTISNNTANGSALGGGGGGIDSSGTLNITNSTISGNTKNNSSNNGGGIYIFGGTTTITSSTVTNNQANTTGSAGGVYRSGGTVTVRNSIIAANQNNMTTPDVFGAFTSSGYNLIGNFGSATGFTGTADQIGVSNANANLAPLADNGGQTPTHRLNAGSFAIDKGNNFGITTDQRGFMRPYDDPSVSNAADGTDIGAFEAQPPTAASVSVGGRVLGEGNRGIQKAYVYLTDQEGNTRIILTNNFGYYTFSNVEVGQTYIFNVYSKGYQYDPLVLTITEEIQNLNFSPQFNRKN